MATTPGAFKFRSQFWAAGSSESEPEPEPEPEPESAGCPPTRNRIVLQGDGWGRPALELTVDELTLDDVEKDPSGNWTLAQYSGLMLWDAATIFARWMHRYAAQVFAGRSVLELGAGSTGLPGLTAHMLGARHVVLTDHLPELVQSLDANIRRCQESRQIHGAHVSAGTIRATMLDWSTVPAQGAAALGLDGAQEQFDIVIGSEVIYEEEHAQWVSSCLSTYVKPGGVVYMIASTRPERPGWVALKEVLPILCGGEFEVEVVPVQGDMPLELYEDVAEETDYLHEMLCGRRRASPSAVVRGGEESLQQLRSHHAFPSVAQTINAPDRKLQKRRPSEPPAVHEGAVDKFLGSMPMFS